MCTTWIKRFPTDPVWKGFWRWSTEFFTIIWHTTFIFLGRVKQEGHYYYTNNEPIKENIFKEQDCLIKSKSLLNRKGNITATVKFQKFPVSRKTKCSCFNPKGRKDLSSW